MHNQSAREWTVGNGLDRCASGYTTALSVAPYVPIKCTISPAAHIMSRFVLINLRLAYYNHSYTSEVGYT